MKGQIDNFFTNLKEKARHEEERHKQAKLENQQKEELKNRLRQVE